MKISIPYPKPMRFLRIRVSLKSGNQVVGLMRNLGWRRHAAGPGLASFSWDHFTESEALRYVDVDQIEAIETLAVRWRIVWAECVLWRSESITDALRD